MDRKFSGIVCFVTIVTIFAAFAVSEVPPVVTEEVAVQKWGEEAERETQREGLLFWDVERGGLYYGDGETPGGRPVCVGHVAPDFLSWTNDAHANGHALCFNQFYSMRGEGNTLAIRYGTNTIWRILGATEGEMARLAVDNFDGTSFDMTADAAAPVLEVCTNLTEADAWTTATNVEVTAQTDASTTWHVTLLNTDCEFYRAMAGSVRAAGVYCERPLYADEGLEVGGPNRPTWNGDGLATSSELADHVSNTNNPHGVTLQQAVDADSNDAYDYMRDEWGLDISPGDGVAALSGFGREICLEDGHVDGEFEFADRPAYSGDGLATTNEVAAVETTVASVERRVGALEYPETCSLYWPPEYVTANWNVTNSVILVPTNFPTRRLELVLCDNGISNLYVRLPSWNPDRDVAISIYAIRDSDDAASRSTRTQYGSQLTMSYTSASNYRILLCDYDSLSQTWTFRPQTLASRPYYGTTSRKDFPSNRPATVEDWLALHPELANP